MKHLPSEPDCAFNSEFDPAHASQQREYLSAHGQDIYFCKKNPADGRVEIFQSKSPFEDQAKSIVRAPFSAKTKFQGYGGKPYTVKGCEAVFINEADQELYFLTLSDPITEPRRLNVRSDQRRHYAYLNLIEDHVLAVSTYGDSDIDHKHQIVSVDLKTGNLRVLLSVDEFIGSIAISGDGSKLAWVQWSRPNMPWDETSLHSAEISQGGLQSVKCIFSPADSFVYQISWSPKQEIFFLSDLDGYSNLHKWHDGRVEQLTFEKADIDVHASKVDIPCYAVVPLGSTAPKIAYRIGTGNCTLKLLDTQTRKKLTIFECDNGTVDSICVSDDFRSGEVIHCLLHQPNSLGRILKIPINTSHIDNNFALSSSTASLSISSLHDLEPIPPFYSSRELISSKDEDGDVLLGYLYSPESGVPNRETLVVNIHGGPIGYPTLGFNPEFYYLLMGGYSVLDVHYHGTIGYGKTCRRKLYGNWGISEVDNCLSLLTAVKNRGYKFVYARGKSAGGYSVLRMAMSDSILDGGACHYAVSDLVDFCKKTHKFESQYVDTLVASLTRNAETLQERSPISNVDSIKIPLIFLHGKKDIIVPASQIRLLYEALQRQGKEAYHAEFPDEGHGYSKLANLHKAMSLEIDFYSKLLTE